MDRLAPTRRPARSRAGTQRWTDLLFVHYEVPIAVLRPLVPARLELDLWEGRAFVGIVPFVMERIAPRMVPSAMGLNFLETNLRTYVHFDGAAPGVYFFSLEASSRIAVRVAKRFFGLPYHDAHMHREVSHGTTAYESARRGADARLRARWRRGRALGPSTPGTLEFFLLERYLLYVERAGTMHVGQVHHSPYPAHDAELFAFDETLTCAAGITRSGAAPACVHASPGVDVEVFSTHPAPWRT